MSAKLYFLVTRSFSNTIQIHLETWGRALNHWVRPIFYEDLVRYRSLRPGTYIFSDLERLSDVQREFAGHVWDTLARSPAPVQLLNNPRTLLRREALLRALHADGTNPFRVYRAGDDLSAARYPLFIRRDNEHDGSLSTLIHSPAELAPALAAARERGIADADLLIVEHCNTADAAGIYRKYAAFRIGSRVFPFHINFSKNWVVKRTEYMTPELEAEEAAFRASTEHHEQLRRIFELAQVDYGRIDFSLLNGRIVVWEINTNPTLGCDPFRAKPHRLPIIHAMVRDLNEALTALRHPAVASDAGAQPSASGLPIPLHTPTRLLRRLGVTPSQQLARHARRALRGLSLRTGAYRAG